MVETHCLIVGGGPTGLTMALLLASYGIKSTVVDRHLDNLSQPRAHAINPRSLEIFRQLGLDTAKLREAGSKVEDVSDVIFASSLTGLEFGSLPYERQGEEAKSLTPEPLFNIPQPTLEEFLMNAILSEKTAWSSYITVKKPFNWERCTQTEDGRVISSVLDRTTNETIEFTSDYIFLCDGANSSAREKLNIPFNPLFGQENKPSHHVSVHFKGDLSAFKPATLWFITSPSVTGTFICYERRSSWVFVFHHDPTKTEASTFTEEYCRKQIDEAIGCQIPYSVLSITIWSTFPRVAEYYRSKLCNRGFFIGDAAHAFPPTGGLGVNTGIADVHNLAWKIHAVMNLKADDRLLETYTHERRPVAIANAKQSTKNQQKIFALLGASQNFLAQSANPEFKRDIDAAIADNAEHFDSINLQIGYIYTSDDATATEMNNSLCNSYEMLFAPGARLPHAWVQKVQGGSTVSILDLIDNKSFVVLAPSTSKLAKSGGNYSTITGSKIPVPVKIIRQGIDFTTNDQKWLSLAAIKNGDKTGLLIRPDQHILGRVSSLTEVDSLILEQLCPSYPCSSTANTNHYNKQHVISRGIRWLWDFIVRLWGGFRG